MSLQLAHQLAMQGRGNDSTLVHMSPKEVGALQAIAAAHGGQLTINPHTGLPEAGFLEKLLPMIAGMALTATTGIPAWAVGLGVGGATAAATGSLNKGIMAGLGAYGGAGLGSGLMAAGAAAPAESLAAGVAPSPGVAVPPIATPSFVDKLSSGFSQMGQGTQNLASGEGFDKFIGNEATKTSAATGLGGGMGAFKYAGAAAMPFMTQDNNQANPNPQSQGNIVDYSFDPVTQMYKRLRSTPASQYQSNMAEGGVAKSNFASGGSADEVAQLKANAIAAGATPEDIAFLDYRQGTNDPMLQTNIGASMAARGENPYSPAYIQMAKQANATAASRTNLTGQDTTPWSQSDWQATQKAANDAEAARVAKLQEDAKNSPFVAGGGNAPSGGGSSAGAGTPTAKPTPKASDNPKAQLQAIYDAYFTDNVHVPVGTRQNWAGGTIEKTGPTTALYTPPGGGKPINLTQGMDVDVVDQLNPNIAKQWQSEFGYTYTPKANNASPNAPATSKDQLQSYYNQYFTDGVPVGYKQNWANGKLEKLTDSTAVYTDPNGKQFVMQKGMDVNNIYSMSPYIASQWNDEYGYTYTPTKQNGVDLTGSNLGPTSDTTGNPFALSTLKGPNYGQSDQGTLTPQGVMGGSEKGGTVANASKIVPAYQQYWQTAPVGSVMDFAGGTLTRTSGAQAVYTGKNGETYSMSPTSDLNIIAANNPQIANTWQKEFGMVPQNYMTGESARNYEFLKGNAPYQVNQTAPGISRPYLEMTGQVQGPKFSQPQTTPGYNDPESGYIPPQTQPSKLISPGAFNIPTIYNPVTGQYVANDQYKDPSADLIKEVAGTPGSSNPSGTTTVGAGKGDPNAPVVVTPGANGGLMANGGLSHAAQHYNLGDYSDGGRLLRGPGDGVSDSIPATIGGKREARLADGEFVVPARIVSELGNGSTEAGARQLYAMMDRIQHNRAKSVGKGKVAVNSKSSKFLPA